MDPTKLSTTPHSFAAERAVLGGILLKSAALDIVRTSLLVDDFLLPAHREIYEVMLALDAKDLSAGDVVLVMNELESRKRMSFLEGGPGYLLKLSGDAGDAENIRHYAAVVKEKAVLRKLIAVCMETVSRAQGALGAASAEDLLAQHRADVEEIDLAASAGPTKAGDLIDGVLEHIERKAVAPGEYVVRTHLTAFDKEYSGLRSSNYIIVGGRPGTGKTAWVFGSLIRMALDGVPTLIFSLEMSAQELLERALGFVGRVPIRLITRGELKYNTWKNDINPATKKLRGIPLYIDDRSDISVEVIRAATRRWAREVDPSGKKMKCVAVDSMSLCRPEKEGRQRVDDVSRMSKGWKRLCRQIHSPVVVLCHTGRDQEKGGKPRKPRPADLRESGSIEQDADMIIFPYREPGARDPGGPVEASLLVAKARGGIEAEIPVAWDERFVGWYDRLDIPDDPI